MAYTLGDVEQHYVGLTPLESQIWLAVANEKTNIVANEAVDRFKRIVAYNEAATIVEEIGRSISAANSAKIADALKALTAAMETINTLLSDETTTETIRLDRNMSPVLVEVKTPVWKTWSVEEAGKILAQTDSFDSKRYAIQNALRNRALAAYAQQKLATMSSTEGSDYDYYDLGPMPYIRDLYEDYVVYRQGNELYQCTYTIDGENVTLGDPIDVQVSYVPKTNTNINSESIVNLQMEGNLVTLTEASVNKEGKVKVKLISPGWGSSGYYSAEMLERDGPKAFKKGTHMYMNHPTAEEDLNRPERDLRDLVGVQEEDAVWMANGPTGPGLYANATVLSPYRQFVDEAAPYIGVSIRASGRAQEGEAEGRIGPLVNALVEGYSVDYVTLPGRGGEVLPLLEAARNNLTSDRRDHSKLVTNNSISKLEEVKVKEVDEVEAKALRESVTNLTTANEQMVKALAEANANIARLTEANILSNARTLVSSVLAGIQMSDMTRARLTESCVVNPPVKDGTLDIEALTTRVQEAAKAELEYLAAVVPTASRGAVVGVGSTATATMTAEETTAKLNESFGVFFDGNSKLANTAARGRN